ncbi:histidine phosphatase superfamily [Syncephalis fuscata]|nr:histidine phosphatase superfamily [Syncephalis fuscata]
MAWYTRNQRRYRRHHMFYWLIICWLGLTWTIWKYLPTEDGFVASWATLESDSATKTTTTRQSHDQSKDTLPLEEQRFPIQPLPALLGTRAPYPLNTAKSSRASKVPLTCELVHFQLLARHATHYPSQMENVGFSELEATIQANKQQSWPSWLKNWRNPYNVDQVDELTSLGRRDMALLAQRDLDRYRRWMHSMAAERHLSAQAYASAFSGRRLSDEQLHTTPLNDDKELSPYTSCYELTADMNDETDAEQQLTKFKIPILSEALVEAMAQACAFEYTLLGISNQWCQLLEPDAVAALTSPAINLLYSYGNNDHIGALTYTDYKQDVYAYSRIIGNNSPVTHISCLLFSRILNEINSIDLYNEVPTLDPAREYHLSRIAPLAANLHIELLRLPIHIPECSNDPNLCPWKQFKKLLESRIGTCNSTKLCGNAKALKLHVDFDDDDYD